MAEITRQDSVVADDLTVTQLKVAADQASADYDYAKAATLYTQALALPGLPPEVEYDLLAGRVHCHERLGQVEASAVDAAAMASLAETLHDEPRLIRAWVRQAQSAYRLGQGQVTVDLASRALERARPLPDRQLEGESLAALELGQYALGDVAGQEVSVRAALECFRATGSRLDEIEALSRLAYYLANHGQFEEGNDLGHRAVALAREAGSPWHEAQALNTLALTGGGLAEKRSQLEQALALFQSVGDHGRQATVNNNLALVYLNLGLYQKARHFAELAVALARAGGAPGVLTTFLDTLARSYGPQLTLAEPAIHEGLAIAEAGNDELSAAYHYLSLGQMALQSKQPETARPRLATASALFQKVQLAVERATALAWQGQAALMAGDWAAADHFTNEAVADIGALGNQSPDFPAQDIWWLRYQVLRAAPHASELAAEASRVLDQARTLLLARVATLNDEGLRRSYFNKVEINHEILLEWARRNPRRAKHTAPAKRGARLEDQFKRLLDIGVRINALGDTSALPDFIAGELEELTGAERIYLVGLENGRQRMLAARGAEAALPARAQPLLEAATTGRRPVLRHDVPAKAQPGDPLVLRQRSALAVPLISRGLLLGFFYADLRTVFGRFTQADADLVEALANQAATALENARLVQGLEQRVAERTAALEQRAAELAIINSVQSGLAAQLDQQAIFDLVGDKIREIFDAQVVLIIIFDRQSGLAHFPYFIERGQRFFVEPKMPYGFSDHIRRTGQMMWLNENVTAHAAAYGAQPLAGDTPKSWLGVPLIAGDEVRGVISLQNVDREHAFSEADVRLLSTLASSLSVALENARLFAEVQERNQEITAALEQQTATSEVLQALSAFQPDLRSLLEIVAVNSAKVCGADDSHIYRIEGEALVEWTHRGPIPGLEDGEALPLSRGSVIGRAILDQQTIHIHDAEVELDEAEYPVSAALQRRWGYRTVLATPLLRDGAPIGGIAIRRTERQPFTEKHVALLKTFAHQAVIAIEKVRLFDETQRLLRDTQQRAAELTIINSVQAGLAAKLDTQAIYDLVGDKTRQIFDAQSIMILTFDHAARMRHARYIWEKGRRFDTATPLPFNALTERLIETRQPVVLNDPDPDTFASLGMSMTPGSEMMKSGFFVPLVVGDVVTGTISLQSVERANAFSEADVRLLTTLSNSMSVALENARLFSETKRLLEQTEQRAAELAVINSVQAGLAAQLDFQGIIDLVGDKLRQVLHTENIGIRLLDHDTGLVQYLYEYEHGQRLQIPPAPPGSIWQIIAQTREPLVINRDMEQRTIDLGITIIPGTDPCRALVNVPILARGETMGSIIVENHEREDAFSEADVRLLTTLASSMSVALENARLFSETKRLLEQTEQRAAELAVINSVGQALAAQLDTQAVFDQVGDKLREIFDAQAVVIAIYERQAERLHYPYLYELGQRFQVPPDPLAGGGFGPHILRTRQPLLINEDILARAADYDSDILFGKNPKAYLGVPLVVGDEARGYIALQNIEHEHAFSDSDVRLLSTLASSLSVAFENARLFAETKRLLEETEQRAAELAVINSVQAGLAAQLDYQAIIELVGDKIRDIFAVASTYIALADSQQQLIRWPYWVMNGQRYYFEPTPLGTGLASTTMQTRQPLRLGTAQAVRDHGGLPPPGYALEDVCQSFLAVPIISGNDAIGTIALVALDEHAFSASDERFLSTLANSLGVALENARLFAETKRLLEETEQRAAELAIINSVQAGLAAQLDFQGIIDLVGDKLREVLHTGDLGIDLFDWEADLCHFVYVYEHGQRLTIPPSPPGMGARLMNETRQPIVVNRDLENWSRQHGVETLAGTDQAKAMMYVPILARDELIGAMGVENHEREDAYTASDVRLLTTLANSMSVALENARLFAETKRLLEETTQRNAELAVINSIQQGLVAEVDSAGIIELVGSKLREVLRTGDIGIRLYDAQANLVHYTYQYEHGRRLYPPSAAPGGLSRYVIETRQPLIINQNVAARFEEIGAGLLPGTDMPLSVAAAPLPGRDGVRGLIVAENYEREGAFSEADTRLLTTIASSLSVALENARLFEETRRRAGEMAALTEIGREVSASLDLNTVLERIGTRAREVLKADTSAVYLLQPNGVTLMPITVVGEEAEAILASPSRLGEGLIGTITETRQPEIIYDTVKDPRSVHIAGTPTTDEGEQLMVAPLLAGENIIGAMSVWRTHARERFGAADLSFLSGLGRQAAIAIENARLFAEVERQREYSEALVTTSPVAIITTDLEDRVVSWNPGAERLFGYTAAEASGRRLDELVAHSPELRSEAERLNTPASHGRLDAITRRNRKDGSLVDVELAGVPVVVAGRQVGFIAIYHDITELQRARQEAESANHAKSAFLATMSHEIRTPMNAVLGMSGLLLDTPLTDEQREFAEIIRNSGDALLNIINDILDFSKIEAGKMELENQPFDLRETVEGALDLVAARAFDKGLDLAYELDERLPATFNGDPARLRQVLLNLLTNAIKFTEQGEVVLSVALGPASPTKTLEMGDSDLQALSSSVPQPAVELQFSVRDTGLGIPPDRMDRLFQSFSQVDASTARKFGGTGLGLAISRRLAELMGGRMWAASEGVPGRGTTFYFTLRAEPVPTPVVTRRELAGAQPLLAGKRVLIVDDNDTNRRILHLQAQKWGLRPRDTASPREALEWVRRGDAFDVAILDMHMPEMDGLSLGTEIRQHRDPASLPLLLFTSLGRREGATGSLLFAAHLTKPIKPSALYDALVGLFAGRAEPGGSARQPEEPARRATAAQSDPHLAERHPLRLLLAEDNAVNQKLALRLLRQMGYRADVAANGLEAVAAVERQPYDVILMDVQMPEMDGLEATRQIIQRWPGRGTRPRIIAMTANAMPGDREMCLAAGMDDYLTKPIRVDALAGALLLSRPRAEQGPRPTMHEPLLDPRTLPDLAASTDAGFVQELIQTYLEDSPRLLDEMRAGLAASNADTVRRAAHSLKSNSASLGALGLSEQAKALELAAKAGQLADAAARIKQLAEHYAAVDAALRTWPHAQ